MIIRPKLNTLLMTTTPKRTIRIRRNKTLYQPQSISINTQRTQYQVRVTVKERQRHTYVFPAGVTFFSPFAYLQHSSVSTCFHGSLDLRLQQPRASAFGSSAAVTRLFGISLENMEDGGIGNERTSSLRISRTR